VLVTRLREDVAGPLKAEFAHVRKTGAVFVKRYLLTTVPGPETAAAFPEGVRRW
jgi:hypothetical protein